MLKSVDAFARTENSCTFAVQLGNCITRYIILLYQNKKLAIFDLSH